MRAISSVVERVLREAREYDRRNLSNDRDSPKSIDAFIDRDLRYRPRGRLIKIKGEDGKWKYIRVSYGSKVSRFRKTHKKKCRARERGKKETVGIHGNRIIYQDDHHR